MLQIFFETPILYGLSVPLTKKQKAELNMLHFSVGLTRIHGARDKYVQAAASADIFFFVCMGIQKILMGSDAGCGDIKPALSIII